MFRSSEKIFSILSSPSQVYLWEDVVGVELANSDRSGGAGPRLVLLGTKLE